MKEKKMPVSGRRARKASRKRYHMGLHACRRSGRRPLTQSGGFLPGLLGRLIGNAIARKKGRRPRKFNAGNYIKNALADRFKIGKVVAGKRIPTPGNTGVPIARFFKSAKGIG